MSFHHDDNQILDIKTTVRSLGRRMEAKQAVQAKNGAKDAHIANLNQSVTDFMSGFRHKWEQCQQKFMSHNEEIPKQASEFQGKMFDAWRAMGMHVGKPLQVGREKLTEALSLVDRRREIRQRRATLAQQLSDNKVFESSDVTKEISLRLDGIPVYTVSNGDDEISFVSDAKNQKSLGLFFFRKGDANAFLSKFAGEEPALTQDAKVITVPLNKVYELQREGITFRFLPDPQQVKNAIEIASQDGVSGHYFPGVPVFQCNDLALRNMNKRLHPVFFNKEDLESSREHALQQKRFNKNLPDIQVGSFEDLISKMESSGDCSAWEDIVFIPPGLNSNKNVESKAQAS
eukprot:TRINITY_DN148_c0_g1_i2.p1 TRINITY_DN148_c0_g1~~TRINITY_DN148_c0_g1_i2.p1  ORF type:complete len:345 (+),score=74.72 TRINITY_DN148_c0_g1_i2:160-1194(+)